MARTVDKIIDDVEAAAGLPMGAIRDHTRRTRDVSLARHVVFYLARRETKLSYAKIGLQCGFGDHKAVLYGFNRISLAVARGGGGDEPRIRLLIMKVAPGMIR